MLWKDHFLFGFLLFLIIGLFFFDFSILDLLLFSLISGVAALLPDLDHKLSKARSILDKLVPISSFIVLYLYSTDPIFSLIATLLISGIYFLMFVFFKPKHRGITHSVFALLLISLLLYLFYPYLTLPIFIGYFSHLILDKCIKLF